MSDTQLIENVVKLTIFERMVITIKIMLLLGINLSLVPVYICIFLLGFVISFIPIFPTRTSLHNIRTHLQKGFLKSHLLLTGLYAANFFYFIEGLFFNLFTLNVVLGEDGFRLHLTQLRAKYGLTDRGFVYVGGHIGNPDILGNAVLRAEKACFKNTFVVIVKPTKVEIINRMIEWLRVRNGYLLLWNTRRDLSDEINRNLSLGRSLALVADQKPKRGGLFVKFFNDFAAFPEQGIMYGVRHRLGIVYVNVVRIIPGIFSLQYAEGDNSHLELQHPPRQVHGNRESKFNEILVEESHPVRQAVSRIVAGFAGWLELLIKDYPSQWCWDYKKWSRKPPQKS